MDLAEVIALIITLSGGGQARADRLAPLFMEESTTEQIDPGIVVAVAFRESSFRTRVKGAAGEFGLMQIKPGGLERYVCKGLKWRTDTRHNIRCGVRILAVGRARCPGAPSRWLGRYKGIRRCGPTTYSERVLGKVPRS